MTEKIEELSPKQTATTESNQETRIQDNNKLLSPMTGALSEKARITPSTTSLLKPSIRTELPALVFFSFKLLGFKRFGSWILDHLARSFTIGNMTGWSPVAARAVISSEDR
jgi:hypothetical protein